MGDSVRVPLSECPFCKRLQDGAQEVTGASEPKVGDITLCFNCGEWSAFNEDLSRRPCDDEELDYIGTNLLCRMIRKKWVEFKRENGE